MPGGMSTTCASQFRLTVIAVQSFDYRISIRL